jgi:hypothetical protein
MFKLFQKKCSVCGTSFVNFHREKCSSYVNGGVATVELLLATL